MKHESDIAPTAGLMVDVVNLSTFTHRIFDTTTVEPVTVKAQTIVSENLREL